MSEGGELRQRVAQGMAWSLAEKAGTMLLQMGVSILVARLLAPEDYGVMAILTVFATLSLVVVDSGFSQILIRSEAPSDDDYRSVFGFNLLAAGVLYFVMWGLAPLLARLYDQPLLLEIAPILFLLLPLNALCVIQQTLFTRHLRFDALSRVVLLSSAFGGAVAIVMALSGCGVWSLVGQRLGAMGSKAVMLWWVSEWRPRGTFRPGALRRMAPYSLRLMATDLISTLYNNISQLFVGKIYSTEVLGYYNQGQKLKDMPVMATLQTVQNVSFPALSKIASDDEKLRESYRQLLGMVAFLLFPMMAGLIAVAPDMFALLLGAKWMPTVPYFEVLCLSGLFLPLSAVSYNLLKVRSDGRIIVRLEMLKKGVMTLILALTIPQGVLAIAWGVVAMAMVEWMLNAVVAAHLSTLKMRSLFATLLGPALLAWVMYVAVKLFALSVELPPALDLLLQILLGVLVYGLGALLFRFEALKIAREVWQRMRRR